jgi:hypothetical protein
MRLIRGEVERSIFGLACVYYRQELEEDGSPVTLDYTSFINQHKIRDIHIICRSVSDTVHKLHKVEMKSNSLGYSVAS